MDKGAATENQLLKLIGPEGMDEIEPAQRLAAADVDVRIALSSTWWSAIFLGMKLAATRETATPPDPFGARQMAEIGEREWPF